MPVASPKSFFGNATNLGVVCVVVEESERKAIADLIDRDPESLVSIDLEHLKVSVGDHSFDCLIKEGALAKAWMDGSFDTLNELLSANSEVDSVVANLEYMRA